MVLIIGLGLAVMLNAYEVRSILLIFASFFFLVILRYAQFDLDGDWFLYPVLFETSFAIVALSTRAKQALWVVAFSVWNLAGHITAYFAYNHDLAIYSLYSDTIRAGELCQVLSLILVSRPVENLVVFRQLKKLERRDGGWKRLGIWAY
jgi:hypothetical protein